MVEEWDDIPQHEEEDFSWTQLTYSTLLLNLFLPNVKKKIYICLYFNDLLVFYQWLMSELILVRVYNITFSEFFFSDWLMYEIRCLVKS